MKNGTLKWLLRVPGMRKIGIFALIVLQTVYGASGVLYALLLRSIVDAATGGDRSLFWRSAVFTVVLLCGQIVLRYIVVWLKELSKSSLENAFKSRLLETLLAKDHLSVSAVHSGEWMNRFTNDAAVVANNYVDVLPDLCAMLAKLVSALVIVFFMETGFALVLVAAGAALLLFSTLFRKAMKKHHKAVQEADGKVRIFLQESLSQLFVARSYATESNLSESASGLMEDHKKARLKRNRFSNIANAGFGSAMSAMYLLGIVWCGYGILAGTSSFGTLTAVMHLVAQIQMPFANITGYLPKYYAMIASAERLKKAEDLPDGVEKALSSAEAGSLYENELQAIGFRDVSFSYPGASSDDVRPVLSGFSMQISKGETVAFTGQSGCGKTTALKILSCVLKPDAGDRYYLDNNGITHKLNGMHRRLFAYVPQDNGLFSGSIREIVSYARPESASDEGRLRKALEIACADEFVENLDCGVDSLLGEQGSGLSEGQMQRLAIARAVFSQRPILLLDEATSALDEKTEKQVLSNLHGLEDRTVIIVTHRPAALSYCDRVFRFSENGVQQA